MSICLSSLPGVSLLAVVTGDERERKGDTTNQRREKEGKISEEERRNKKRFLPRSEREVPNPDLLYISVKFRQREKKEDEEEDDVRREIRQHRNCLW